MPEPNVTSESVAPDPALHMLPQNAALALGVPLVVLKEVMRQHDIPILTFGKLTRRIRTSDLPMLQRLIREHCGEPAQKPKPPPPEPYVPPPASLGEVLEEIRTLRKDIAELKALVTRRISPRKSISPTQKLRIYARDNNHCRYCDKRLNRNTATLDHILSVSRGGDNEDINLVAACRSCNHRKGVHLPSEVGMKLLPIADRDITRQQFALCGQQNIVTY